MGPIFWIFLMLAFEGSRGEVNDTSTTPIPMTQGRRPSIWSRTVHHLRRGGYRKPYFRKSTEMRPVSDQETQFLNSAPVLSLKEFANQLVNDTATFFESTPRARSYPGTGAAGSEDPSQQQQQQLWDDKDQAYHASSYAGLDYEPPTSYHHPFSPHPSPVHYYPAPQKKDETLFTKVALIALLKLILAKLKAIGFLKLILLFMLKVPLLFFKMLIVFKGFKFLKLLSIPFLIAAFGLPFLPLIPFLFLAFIPFLFLVPLAVPLLLPFLMFLPIIPVTTPPTAPVANRRRRDLGLPQSVTANQTWSVLDEQWKANRTRRMFKTRGRPISAARRQSVSRFEPFLNEENSENLLELTQRVVQSQHCLERAACEIAAYNDSKIYQSAVIWALGKLQTFASPTVQRKIQQYSHAYENGLQKRSSNYCAERFQCTRPKILLVQGTHTYNVL